MAAPVMQKLGDAMRFPVLIICIFLLSMSVLIQTGLCQNGPEQLTASVQDSTAKDVEKEIRLAELRRVEAEQHKLSLEAREIERRLNSRWWEGQKLTEYLLAIVIASALLFGWTRAYLEPILRKETEVNKLAEQRNATLNELLDTQVKLISQQRKDATTERDWLKQEGKALKTEQEILKREQHELKLRVAGLNLAVGQAAKKGEFFSILNSDDPINELSNSHGWKVWSDNYFGKFGYYLVIQHDDVRSNNANIVARITEFDELVSKSPKEWRAYIDKINNHFKGGPLLVLDYSYFGLFADKNVPVGGKLYRQDLEDIEFYAPLSEWSKNLAPLLNE